MGGTLEGRSEHQTKDPGFESEHVAAPFGDVTLDDKFDLSKTRIFATGTQAVVRLLLMQKERDRRAGLNTAGFVSGYRGSPIGGLDQQFFRAAKLFKAQDIVFQPGGLAGGV